MTMIWRPYNQLLIIIVLLLAMQSISMAASNVLVSATILSSNNCRFNPPNSKATLAFNNLDPTNPVPVTATTSLVYRCGGSAPIATFIITADDGQHFSGGSRRMVKGGTDNIPYQLTLIPQALTAPRSIDQTLTINGLIDGAGYQYATFGDYIDLVTLSINP